MCCTCGVANSQGSRITRTCVLYNVCTCGVANSKGSNSTCGVTSSQNIHIYIYKLHNAHALSVVFSTSVCVCCIIVSHFWTDLNNPSLFFYVWANVLHYFAQVLQLLSKNVRILLSWCCRHILYIHALLIVQYMGRGGGRSNFCSIAFPAGVQVHLPSSVLPPPVTRGVA